MSKFTDDKGREWTLKITVYEVEQVLEQAEINLANILNDNGDPTDVSKQLSDPVTFARVLFILCEDQCAELGVEPKDFGRGLSGDAIDAAEKAFYEALVNFCRPRQRALLTKQIELGTAYQTELEKRVQTISKSGKLEAEIQRQLAAIDHAIGLDSVSS